jgi:hypothetical protein
MTKAPLLIGLLAGFVIGTALTMYVWDPAFVYRYCTTDFSR